MHKCKNTFNKLLCIIIIGIGDADFSSMEELDGDGDSRRERDLVQFVAFNDINRMMGHDSGQFSNVNQLLAGEVLAELPKQVELYRWRIRIFDKMVLD